MRADNSYSSDIRGLNILLCNHLHVYMHYKQCGDPHKFKISIVYKSSLKFNTIMFLLYLYIVLVVITISYYQVAYGK